MKYLITGGCGFTGCNFALKLLERGEEVILLDNLSRQGAAINLEFVRQRFPTVKFVHVDLRIHDESLPRVVEQVDAVFHLAGQVAVTTSVIDPRNDFNHNAVGTLNVLEAIRLSDRKPCIIFSSTNKVYGGMEEVRIEERNDRYVYRDFPNGISEMRQLDFHSPYGCSKGTADQYVRDYARIYGLKTVVMRQSCIYGPRQFGIEDQGWVAWFTIASVLGKKITIYGDGKQVRDVLHVDDLFKAWDLAHQKIDAVSGMAFNVGGGPEFTMSLLELISILGRKLGKKIVFSFSDWRPGDQPVYISDISHAKEHLGWWPLMSVDNGVETLTNWVIENKYLFTKNSYK